MYERNLGRSLARIKIAGLSLLFDFLRDYFGFHLADGFIFVLNLIYPIIESNGTFCILLYVISQYQTWYLSLPKYIMKGRRTDSEFLCYASLFLIITLHPFCKFVHFVLFFCFFLWTKIRYSDTFVIIASDYVVY